MGAGYVVIQIDGLGPLTDVKGQLPYKYLDCGIELVMCRFVAKPFLEGEKRECRTSL